MFDFADRFNKLNLTDEEVAIFSAIVLLSPGNKDFNLLSNWKLDMEAISAKTLTMHVFKVFQCIMYFMQELSA